MSMTTLDRVIGWISPSWAANRAYYRWATGQLSSYRGGLSTRLSGTWDSSSGKVGRQHPTTGTRMEGMRDRARKLERDNVLASSMLDRAVENVIGSGPQLQCRSSSAQWNETAELLWRDSCDELDVRGMSDFGTLCQLLYRSRLRDGDIGVVLVDRGGRPYLQAIEGDLIQQPYKYRSDTIDGIRFNAVGRPLEFYIRDGMDPANLRITPVGADNFIYLPRYHRLSAIRGESVFAQTFGVFDHFDGYIEAVTTAARAGACQALIITKQNPSNPLANLPTVTNSAGNAQRSLAMEPMMIHYARPGEDVKGFTPTQPTQSFPEFTATLARIMGTNLGLTLEQVMLDFSRVNYSSSRAARLQAEATASDERTKFTKMFLSRVWRWWSSKQIKSGLLPAPPEDYYAHEWVWDARPWVDPEKELKAALVELDMGLTTLTLLAKERGREFAQLVQQRKAELDMLKKADIPAVQSNQTRDMGAAAAKPVDPQAPPGNKGDDQEDADDQADDAEDEADDGDTD